MKKLFIGVLISLLGLYFAFKNIDFNSLAKAISEANIWWILFASALLIISIWIRAYRWQVLVDPIKHIQVKPLFATTMIGYFGNNVLPFRLGEILRAYALKKEESISMASSFGTIVVERLLDMLGFIVLMFIFFIWNDIPDWLSHAGIISGSIVIVACVVLWWISNTHQDWIVRFEEFSLFQKGIGKKFVIIFDKFVHGLITLREANHVGRVILTTILLWSIYLVITYASACAVNLSLNWKQAGVVLITTTLAISIPSAPGYIGTWHAASVLVLVNIYNQPVPISQAYAIINHGIGFLPPIIFGFFYFIRSSIRLREIRDLDFESQNNS